ncbi:unnamed protein product [Urochloa decumbens]|uniref:Protein kinase domain-containing protein n=1 Tax=Urochloa decumbens TaxID=240449 RepID=A0ABC9AHR2_9POAL
MADIAFISVGKIIQVAGKIKDAVDTVKQNKEECEDIKSCVARVEEILGQLDHQTAMNPALSGTLEDLAKSVDKALELVNKCQQKHIISHLWGANSMAKKLNKVQEDIWRKLQMGNFATHVSVYKTLHPQDAGAAGTNSHGQSTSDARPEVVNSQKGKMAVGTVSRAQSDPVADSKSTPAHDKKPKYNILTRDRLLALLNQERFEIAWDLKVELENESVVIKEFQWKKSVKARFVDELKLILKLKHKNIVRLMGYCYEYNESLVQDGSDDVRVDNKHHFCFVSRYMLKGSLVSIIEGGQNIDWPTLFRITQGIAKGIRYLHEQSVLHLDLKPKNILLDAHMIPKINNFESATKFISDEVKITRNVNNRIGRLEYIAPELSSNKPKASTKSDVYSFGVILLEAISRMCATSEKGRPRGRNEWVDRLEGSDQLGNLFDSALVREELQTKAAIGCAFIGLMCCERDPADRPSMPEVVDMLDAYSHTWNTNNTNKVPSARRSQAKGKEKEQVVEAANRKASSSSPSQVTIKDSSKSTPVRDKKPNYNILTRDKLLALMKQERFEMARDLNVAEGVAELLLCRYSWSPVTVRKKWSANREAVCKTVGWRSSDERPLQWFGTCMLCGMEFVDRISPGSCGHYYCQSCWRAYFSRQVRGSVVGWMCLNMRCPDPSCQAPVVRELVEKMADKADKDLYDKQVLHSWYPEKMAYAGRFWRWCPLDCGRAIEFLGYYGPNDGEDVACDCGHNFCWR